ncbi:MAG: calcium-binding protein [Halofilum sp. (in: g-proteobacteria)]|nr:calcium-binding protein [Halofilum sp. (in: g-proteobacteria)]
MVAELDAHARGEVARGDIGAAAAMVLAAREVAADGEALGLDQAHRFDGASRLSSALEAAGIDVRSLDVTDLVVANMHGELVVAVGDPARPDAAIRDLPHASVDAYAADFDVAMLHVGGGRAWALEDLLALAGVEPGGGAVHLGPALAEAFSATGEVVLAGQAASGAVRGSGADETLIGWQGADVLVGGGGDDHLVAGLGSDTLRGGAGADTVDYRRSDAGVAVDLAAGEGRGGHAEGDRLDGVERALGSAAADRLSGDAGANELAGNGGGDALHGRGGDDVLHGGRGADAARGWGGGRSPGRPRRRRPAPWGSR